MPLNRKVGLDPSDTVLDGDPAPPPQKSVQNPQFSAHVYCAQTAGLINMPLSTKASLGPGRIVLHGDPAPPPKRGTAPPISGHVCCSQTVAHLSYC